MVLPVPADPEIRHGFKNAGAGAMADETGERILCADIGIKADRAPEDARRFGRDQTVYDPWHYVPVLARKPGALRNGAPFKDWTLPGAHAHQARLP